MDVKDIQWSNTELTLMNKHELYAEAAAVGLRIAEHSPGDGVTRYRFFRRCETPESQTYYGPKNGIYTALGSAQAVTFLVAYGLGRASVDTSWIDEALNSGDGTYRP